MQVVRGPPFWGIVKVGIRLFKCSTIILFLPFFPGAAPPPLLYCMYNTILLLQAKRDLGHLQTMTYDQGYVTCGQ